MSPLLRFIFIFFAVGVGIYPALYVLLDMSGGLFAFKPDEVLNSNFWKTAFYLHISFGGLSLLAGWSQFSKRFRSRHLSFHRRLGKVYLIAVMISGLCGLFISFFATGGIVPMMGFGSLALAWLLTSGVAYRSILMKDIDSHQRWMIRSYALTFAAVTLRIWLPLSLIAGIQFINAYRVIAWLCWVPNLIAAELIVRRMQRQVFVATKIANSRIVIP